MIFEVVVAKDGQPTLLVDGRYIYSKYKPIEDVKRFIDNEYDASKDGYVLIGLGLGYHAKILSDLQQDKPIYIMCLDQQEIELASTMPFYEDLIQRENVHLCKQYSELVLKESYQIIIPNVWLQIIDTEHPLHWLLSDIKMKQVSFRRFEHLLSENFICNTERREFALKTWQASLDTSRLACLISSGPSLTNYIELLKYRDDVYILCVGSALKALLRQNVVPDAVIITDSQENVSRQLEDSGFVGRLFYLSTAAAKAVNIHAGESCMLLQKGYQPAEHLAKIEQYPLLETGGSVATTAYSLLRYLGFQQIVLFGQDLCVLNNQTHDTYSTSGRIISERESFLYVTANNGGRVKTLPNLYSYLKWFEHSLQQDKNIKVYNTSINGAYINGTILIDEEAFKLLGR